ncbi:MAG: PEP-utilizing enzyme [Vicinamibacterales bacterium]
MIDRSMSALRTLRPQVDSHLFWFRDDLHQPYPISPMGMTTIQKHHPWGYHVAAEQTQLPPSKGAYVKVFKGRVYLGFTLIDDPAEIGARAKKFGKLIEYCKDHWAEYYRKHINEIVKNIKDLHIEKADGLSTTKLLAHVKQAEEMNRRAWEIHFILMYPADGLYLEFEAYCKTLGLEEKDFVTLLKGFEGMPAKTDEELWKLARLAVSSGLKGIFEHTPPEKLWAALEKKPAGKQWLKKFKAFLSVYGNRISAAHLDVLFPTWKESPAPVLETVITFFRRMEGGWDLAAARTDVIRMRNDAIAAFEKTLVEEKGFKPKQMKEFRRFLKAAQQIYAYQEDHGFYIDQGCTAALHYSLMAAGRRLQKYGLLNQPEDVFYLTFSELVEVLDDLTRDEKIGAYHHIALVPPLVVERKHDREMSYEADAPLTVGNVPKTMTDPIAIKVFGIIDDVLHPKGEKKVVERLKGFPGAPGKAEGPARVILNFEDFPSLKAGEILVCPYTGTAWTPLFMKISAVVTDTGGMLTHAAIAAREYGIAAVVGTWNATNSIRNGDIIRVDGDAGTVDVVKRA